jgi:hypothetical protein
MDGNGDPSWFIVAVVAFTVGFLTGLATAGAVALYLARWAMRT